MIEPGPDEPGPFGIAFSDVVVEADHIDFYLLIGRLIEVIRYLSTTIVSFLTRT